MTCVTQMVACCKFLAAFDLLLHVRQCSQQAALSSPDAGNLRCAPDLLRLRVG